ncbi:MAG: phenylalanyl-tRNA synthetase beta chain [Desulforhopalus sp.]|jgi:phenylalanyl-tRNA synthetase beta chain
MKFTLSWLKNYIDTGDLTPEQLSDELTMLGLEVDSVTPLFQDLAALKTGLVVSREDHPDADKLSLCQVQIGDETHQIVCGAPNVREGLAVVVALPGAVLPGNFKISKSKIRGVASFGMICSESELGLSNEHDGIMELPEGTEHGQVFIDAMGLSDLCIDVDLTPNRPDCASVIGVAREVASVVSNTLDIPVTDARIEATSSDFSVEIANPELCPRYAGQLITGVTIAPSPWWLRKLLISVGLRPINNVVDITNFVMLEYGQPLHAFDFDNLADGKIIVRTPTQDELAFSTLDKTERTLDPGMLMICDGKQPVAVAGVMGGLNSEVSPTTTKVLLESACFNSVSIRKTARMLNLSTDASYRFERGVDPEGTINALQRAAQLICELGGGEMRADGVDCYPGKVEVAPIALSISRTNTLLGLELTSKQISDMLCSIELSCVPEGDNSLMVTAPSFRIDIEREADLVEEVARLYGYNNIPTSLPTVDLSYPEQDPSRLKRLSICKKLTTIGYTEAINYSFIANKHVSMLGIEAGDKRFNSLKLLNPLSEDQDVMRTTLLPGLLENVKRNINFQRPAIKLFELGKVFYPQGKNEQPIEENRLAGVLTGNIHGEGAPLYFKHTPVDIFDAKGCVEFILDEMDLGAIADDSDLQFKIPENSDVYATEGYYLELFYKESKIGTVGRFQDTVLRSFSIKNEVFYFDLDFDALCGLQTKNVKFSSLPVYPSVKRDIALLVEEHISAGQLLTAVQTSRDKLIEDSEIFDVFQGEKIPAGYKSVALTITYRSQTKTLTEKNVEKSHSKIVRTLTEEFGGSFRNA